MSLKNKKNDYRISSFKHRGVYKIPKVLSAAFIGGGIY